MRASFVIITLVRNFSPTFVLGTLIAVRFFTTSHNNLYFCFEMSQLEVGIGGNNELRSNSEQQHCAVPFHPPAPLDVFSYKHSKISSSELVWTPPVISEEKLAVSQSFSEPLRKRGGSEDDEYYLKTNAYQRSNSPAPSLPSILPSAPQQSLQEYPGGFLMPPPLTDYANEDRGFNGGFSGEKPPSSFLNDLQFNSHFTSNISPLDPIRYLPNPAIAPQRLSLPPTNTFLKHNGLENSQGFLNHPPPDLNQLPNLSCFSGYSGGNGCPDDGDINEDDESNCGGEYCSNLIW